MRRKRQGKPTLIDPDLFRFPHFRLGITQQMLQQITLGGAMIVLPIFLQMTLEYNAMQAGLSLAPLSLSMFAVAMLAGRMAGKRRASSIVCAGFALTTVGLLLVIPLVPRADFGWWLIGPLLLAGSGLGLLVSQLNNYTLAPIEEERVSEAAGVNSAAGSFGLSFGLAVAGGIMLAALSLSFTTKTEASTVIPPAQQEQIAQALEEDAQVLSNTQLDALLDDATRGRPRRDPAHQLRGSRPLAPGRVARVRPRQPDRAAQLVPDEAPPGHRPVGLTRRDGPRLTLARWCLTRRRRPPAAIRSG